MPDILFFGHKEFPCGPTRGTKRFLRTWPPHKPLQVSIAMRALGLAVSKNLDRIHWQSLWVALGAHSLSDHSICSGCMPSCRVKSQQTLNAQKSMYDNDAYLSLRCLLDMAFTNWRTCVYNAAVHMMDGGNHLMNRKSNWWTETCMREGGRWRGQVQKGRFVRPNLAFYMSVLVQKQKLMNFVKSLAIVYIHCSQIC